VLPPFADESTLLLELQALARQGKYREIVDRIRGLPTSGLADRTPFALLAAEAHGRLGELDPAARWAERALDAALRLVDNRAELRAVHLKGAIAWQLGALAEAEGHFQRALELARELRDLAAEARAFNNLGILQDRRGDTEEALTTYQLALAAHQQAGNLRGMAETHTNLEISWLTMGNARLARETADEAVRLAREVGDATLLGVALVARAEASLALGDPDLAGAELVRAEEAYQSVRFAAGLAEIRRLQAMVARARDDTPRAKQLLEQARDLAPQGASPDTEAEIERDLGDVLAALGDGVAARAARERAVTLFRRLGARRAEQALAALLAAP
jgi:tetratricopeptide (TPR) repeat protein